MGILGSVDMGIRNHCDEGDIIIDLSPNDSLIGKQVFKLINNFFHQNEKWIIYSNYLLTNQGKLL